MGSREGLGKEGGNGLNELREDPRGEEKLDC